MKNFFNPKKSTQIEKQRKKKETERKNFSNFEMFGKEDFENHTPL